MHHSEAISYQPQRLVEPIRLPSRQPAIALQEIRMVHCLLGTDPARRIVHQQRLQQIQPFLAQHLHSVAIHHLLLRLPLPLRERRFEVWEGSDTRPLRLRRRAQDSEDLENLVNLAVSREQWLARRHLREDAPDTPHVDSRAVLAATKQDLGRTVPECDDFVGVSAERDAEGAGETEVGELEVAFLVDEEVLGFEIAVEDAVGVAVAGTLEELGAEFADLKMAFGISIRLLCVGPSMKTGCAQGECVCVSYHVRSHPQMPTPSIHYPLRQWLSSSALAHRQRLHVFLQVQVQVLKHQVQFMPICVYNVKQPNDIRIVHLLQQGDLADCGGGDALIFGLEADFLERDDALLRCSEIAGFIDDAVGACAGRGGLGN